MTHTTASRVRLDDLPRKRLLWALRAFVLVATVSLALGLPALLGVQGGLVAAQTNNTSTPTDSIDERAPYYANQTPEVANQSWMAGRQNVTLPNLLNYFTRIGPFIVGSGVTAQGGTGSAGAMVFGFIVLAGFLGMMVGSGVGPVGGAVLTTAIGFGLVGVGLLAGWLYALLLFVLGLVLTAVYISAVR